MAHKDPEQARAYYRAYRLRHAERIRSYMQAYQNSHKDEIAAQHKQVYLRKKEEVLAKNKARRLKNRDVVNAYWRSPEGRAKGREKAARRRSTVAGAIQDRLRCRLWRAVHRQGAQKASSTWKLIGCERDHLVAHLASLFADGMTMEALMDGRIEIDHIRPCASFDLTDPEQQKTCFHYTNLQPLWMVDNRRKNARWEAA